MWQYLCTYQRPEEMENFLSNSQNFTLLPYYQQTLYISIMYIHVYNIYIYIYTYMYIYIVLRINGFIQKAEQRCICCQD